ncbi:hypothetical protein [Nocardia jiangxiensis]|uniref:Transposase IS116/IS110/IS902 family protein n=1 Tax=Nocardia jiangxiensis TaxID=282685 RepID=A0ABW6RX91_9NOCA|nr:hypothetical protein [Nocardia jiangxiensis]
MRRDQAIVGPRDAQGQAFGLLCGKAPDPVSAARLSLKQISAALTRASGKKKIVAARFVHNDRLIDALLRQAFSSLTVSPGARAYYDKHRSRGLEHRAALRQLANRLVGILHGCLKTRTVYDETAAWSSHAEEATAA